MKVTPTRILKIIKIVFIKKKGSPKDDPYIAFQKYYFLESSQVEVEDTPATEAEVSKAAQESSASFLVALIVASVVAETPAVVTVHLQDQSFLHEARERVKNAAIAIKVTFFI